MWVLYSIYLLSIIATAIHIVRLPKAARTTAKIIEIILLYQVVFSLGLTSFLAFIGLTFMPEYVANYLGWPSCPFQQELANVNLAFGCLGVLAIWYRGHFWTATILGFSIWIMSDGVHHIWDWAVNKNPAEGNIGTPLYTDLLIPLELLILLYLYLSTRIVEKHS